MRLLYLFSHKNKPQRRKGHREKDVRSRSNSVRVSRLGFQLKLQRSIYQRYG